MKTDTYFMPKIGRLAVTATLIVFCLMGMAEAMKASSLLYRLFDAGYGDSYILFDVLRFQQTGVIYRDLTLPPYLPAQYSPLVYILYSFPGRIMTWANPFVGPRLIALGAFIACIAVVASIVRKLIPAPFMWAWGVLLASSISSMWVWTIQIRGDFPGMFFNLLAIRLLLSRSRWAVVLAGLSAGLALQFKFTFVAGCAAGALWLLVRKQWTDLARFVVMAAATSAGLYLLYSLREPGMLSQMLALSPGLMEVRGAFALAWQAASEPVMLLALLGLPPVAWRVWPRGSLVLIFALISFAVAVLTDLQAGGNINYYFESLFAVVPIAALGVLRLTSAVRRRPMLGFFLVCVFGLYWLEPRAEHLLDQLRNRAGQVQATDKAFVKLGNALRGQRIFSTVPRFALLDPEPPLVEPYLYSYLHLLGKLKPTPIPASVRGGEYDVVITAAAPQSWRGISLIDPDLHTAIDASYETECAFEGWLVHLPVEPRPGGSSLGQELAGIGCEPVSGAARSRW